MAPRKNIRTQQNIEAERRHYMRSLCREYISIPVDHMTGRQVKAFALNAAADASLTLCMDSEETVQYGNAIYGAIQYFNKRSEAHAQHMRYLAECEAMRKMSAAEEKKRKAKNNGERISVIG